MSEPSPAGGRWCILRKKPLRIKFTMRRVGAYAVVSDWCEGRNKTRVLALVVHLSDQTRLAVERERLSSIESLVCLGETNV